MILSAIGESSPNRPTETTSWAPEGPGCAGPGQGDQFSDYADSPPSKLDLELDRLAALDHQDALEKHSRGPGPDMLGVYSTRLATVFATVAQLLGNSDHDQQTLELAVRPHVVRVLALAHESRAQSVETENMRSMHQNYATQLRDHLRTDGSRGNVHTEADAI